MDLYVCLYSMNIVDLGNRIRQRREKLGLKQTDIANALQVSPQAVSKWERGENAPDITIIVPLVRLLGVSAGWLLGTTSGTGDVFDATIFVSDIQGFADRVQDMTEKDAAAWMNGIFHQVTEAVLQHEGVPVKYMGDGFLAFFSGADHEKRALAAARSALKTVTDSIMIALHAGKVFLGAIGHHDYSSPDILGDAVNMTFRLITRHLAEGNRGVVLSRATAEAAGCTDGKNDRVRFKGVSDPVEITVIEKN